MMRGDFGDNLIAVLSCFAMFPISMHEPTQTNTVSYGKLLLLASSFQCIPEYHVHQILPGLFQLEYRSVFNPCFCCCWSYTPSQLSPSPCTHAHPGVRPTASSLRTPLGQETTPASHPPLEDTAQLYPLGALDFMQISLFFFCLCKGGQGGGTLLTIEALTQLYIYQHRSEGRYLLGRDSTAS